MSQSKRIYSRRALLASSLGTLLLTACGGGNPNPGNGPTPTAGSSGILGILPHVAPTPTPLPQKVRFAHWLQDAAAPLMAGLVNNYNSSHPDVDVQEEVTSFGNHQATLRQALAAGTAPDLFLISGPDLTEQVSSKTLLDLAPLVSRDKMDLTRYWSSPQTSPIAGQQLALPLWCEVDLVYVNHDLLGNAKVASPTTDWTWNDLVTTAAKLTVGKPGEVSQWGLLIVNDIQGGWGGMVASNGGRWLDSSTGKTALDANAVEALGWIVDAMNRQHVAPTPRDQETLTQGGTIDPFLAGKVAMLVNGTWEMPALLSAAEFHWDILPLPKAPKTGQSRSVADAQPGSISRGSKVADASWGFLSYLVDETSQRQWVRGKVRLPSLVVVAADATAGYATPPPARAAAVSDALTTAQDLAFRPNWQAFRSALITGLQPAFNGNQLLSDVIPTATKAADQALGMTVTAS